MKEGIRSTTLDNSSISQVIPCIFVTQSIRLLVHGSETAQGGIADPAAFVPVLSSVRYHLLATS